jgi:predicted transcriptional regulator
MYYIRYTYMSMDQVFEALKLSPREIKVLKHLLNHKQSTSMDIQHAESLQQPEVSMATKELLAKKYIRSEVLGEVNSGKRQTMIYSLVDDFKKVMADQLKTLVTDLLSNSDLYTSLIEELEEVKKDEDVSPS